jgi:hypothetical protein
MEDYRKAFTWQRKEFLGTDKELDGHFVHLGRDWADAPENPQMPLGEFLEKYYPIYLHGSFKSLDPDCEIVRYKVVYVFDDNSFSLDDTVVKNVSIFDDKLNLIFRCNTDIGWEWFCNCVLGSITNAFTERGIAFDFDFHEAKDWHIVNDPVETK